MKLSSIREFLSLSGYPKASLVERVSSGQPNDKIFINFLSKCLNIFSILSFSFYSRHKFRHCLHTTHKRFSKKNSHRERQKYESLHENKDIPQPSIMVTQASEVKGSSPVTPAIQKGNCTTERQDLLTGNGTTLEKDNSAKRSKELKRGSVLRGA